MLLPAHRRTMTNHQHPGRSTPESGSREILWKRDGSLIFRGAPIKRRLMRSKNDCCGLSWYIFMQWDCLYEHHRRRYPQRKPCLSFNCVPSRRIYRSQSAGRRSANGWFAIRHLNLNRFAHTRQSFFITARNIKFVFPRFHNQSYWFSGAVLYPVLTIGVKIVIIVVATEIWKNDFWCHNILWKQSLNRFFSNRLICVFTLLWEELQEVWYNLTTTTKLCNSCNFWGQYT